MSTLVRGRASREADTLLAEIRALRMALAETEEARAGLARELEDTNRGVVALYAELEERAELAHSNTEAKSRFLSQVSHELRSPLGSIVSIAGILLAELDGPLGAEQRHQVELIRSAARGLGGLVDDLLDLARVEAGKTPVRVSRFSLEELFGTLRGTLRPLVTSPAVALVFDAPERFSPLVTDPGIVTQILRNLVSNALKFTERGEVRVSASAGPADTVVFAVSDTGIGIAPQHQARVFEEFFQIDVPAQRRVKGTGLGLPLARKLARLLGGAVTLESALGTGSTFRLVVPREHRDASPVESGPVPAASLLTSGPAGPDAAGGPTLLVIDDSEVSRYVLRQLLAERGLRIEEATSGADGLARARASRPSCILLDLDLREPDLPGYQVFAELSADPATSAVPVIVYTSARPQEIDRAALAGTAAVVSKNAPTRAEAVAALEEALLRAGLQAGPRESGTDVRKSP